MRKHLARGKLSIKRKTTSMFQACASITNSRRTRFDHAPTRRLQGRVDMLGARLGFVHV